jgi:hypothetical protein
MSIMKDVEEFKKVQKVLEEEASVRKSQTNFFSAGANDDEEDDNEKIEMRAEVEDHDAVMQHEGNADDSILHNKDYPAEYYDTPDDIEDIIKRYQQNEKESLFSAENMECSDEPYQYNEEEDENYEENYNENETGEMEMSESDPIIAEEENQ